MSTYLHLYQVLWLIRADSHRRHFSKIRFPEHKSKTGLCFVSKRLLFCEPHPDKPFSCACSTLFSSFATMFSVHFVSFDPHVYVHTHHHHRAHHDQHRLQGWRLPRPVQLRFATPSLTLASCTWGPEGKELVWRTTAASSVRDWSCALNAVKERTYNNCSLHIFFKHSCLGSGNIRVLQISSCN